MYVLADETEYVVLLSSAVTQDRPVISPNDCRTAVYPFSNDSLSEGKVRLYVDFYQQDYFFPQLTFYHTDVVVQKYVVTQTDVFFTTVAYLKIFRSIYFFDGFRPT